MNELLKNIATKEDIAVFRQELRFDTSLIKWMFIFWIGQVGAMLAIAMFLIKK